MERRTTILITAAALLAVGAGTWWWLRTEEPAGTATADSRTSQPGTAAPVTEPGSDPTPYRPNRPPLSTLPGDQAFREAMTQLEDMGARSREAQHYIVDRGRGGIPDLLAELRAIRDRQADLSPPAVTDRSNESEYARLEIRKLQIVTLLGEIAGPDVAPALIEVSRSSLPDSIVHQYVSVVLRQIGAWPAARQYSNQILADTSASSVLVRQALAIQAMDPTPDAVAEAVRRAQDQDALVQDVALRVAARAGRKEVLPQIEKLLETPRRDSRDLGALIALAELRSPAEFARDLEKLRGRDFVRAHLRQAQDYNEFKWADESTRERMAPAVLQQTETNLVIEGLRFLLARGNETELVGNGIVVRLDALSGKPTRDGSVLAISPEWKSLVAMSGYDVSVTDGSVHTRKL